MRAAFWLLAIVALAFAQDVDDIGEPWVEEEELEEPYMNEREDHTRSRKADVDEPYEEQVRVRRRCCDYEYDPAPPRRMKRSPEPEQYNRKPRQVHQYEVHEFIDEGSSFPSPPYEEMLAASAEHYHRVYAAPGAPAFTHHHGSETSKGHKTNHWVDKGGKGHKEDEHHRKVYAEATGKKHKHHDNAGHKGSHEEEAHGSRGAHFDEKKGHKKGHKTKGYHNKYHKDEFHKEHKFYDDYHKSGEHHRFGKFHAKHASNDSGKKKAHHLNAGHDVVEKGKKGYSNKGHVDADHKGYKGGHGHEEHHEKHSDYGNKGGKEGGKSWGYSKQ
ncbi:histidine-rich glycoprotein-like isoform X2 [Hyposmocoma kahamanoa]|uniref:histidine-rich glycoprotein-like isoform X2 n=1 Tax=Hyposmocoma kahamanoa TaxID=1477025 RepID=UPI000E6D6060|nr:histidine-rich glycoprotein-like isoform X2 [Hyposmocoma kahamanoa]